MRKVSGVWGFGTALLALAAAACAHQNDPPHPTPGPSVEGRSLTLRVEMHETTFDVCGRIGSRTSSFYLTGGLRYQLYQFFKDESGRPAYTKSQPYGFMPSLPPNPPPFSSGGRYLVISEDEALEDCGSYRYDDLTVDRIHVQAEFRSWLRREEVLEAPLQANIASGYIKRPLYSDEPLSSNACVVDLKARHAQCG